SATKPARADRRIDRLQVSRPASAGLLLFIRAVPLTLERGNFRHTVRGLRTQPSEDWMLASQVITVSIRRSYAEVYDFLAEPLNFSRWASNPGAEMEPLDGGDWLVDLPRGRSVIR